MPCPIFVPCVTICNAVSTPVTETSHCVFGSVTFCNGALISSLSSRIWRFYPTFLPGNAEDDLSHPCPIFVPLFPTRKAGPLPLERHRNFQVQDFLYVHFLFFTTVLPPMSGPSLFTCREGSIRSPVTPVKGRPGAFTKNKSQNFTKFCIPSAISFPPPLTCWTATALPAA